MVAGVGPLLFVLGELLFDRHECLWHTLAFSSGARGSAPGWLPPPGGRAGPADPGRDRVRLIDATIIATGQGLVAWCS